jgi:hypothetical protein
MMRSRLDSDHLFGSWGAHSNPQTGNVAFNSSVELQKILGTAGHCWALQKNVKRQTACLTSDNDD